MKLLILLFISFLLIKLINTSSYTLTPTQTTEVNKIQLQYNGVIQPSPCNYYELFGCIALNDGTGYYSISSIQLNGKANETLISSVDWSVFKNLTNLYLGLNIKLEWDIYQEMKVLENLNTLSIGYTPYDLNDNIILPASLEIFAILYASNRISASLFGVKSFSIYNTLPGYSLPINLPNNSSLTYLQIPIYYNCTLPNLSPLSNLEKFRLVIENGKIKNYIDFKFPSSQLESSNSLSDLEINFDPSAIENDPNGTIQKWDIENISKLKNVRNLKILNEGFTSSKTISDLRTLPNGIKFDIQGSCEILNCNSTSPCLLLPFDTQFYTAGCSFNVENVNYYNFNAFVTKYNQMEQPLPSNFNYSNIGTVDFSTVTNYNGTIPDDYCKINGDIHIYSDKLIGPVPSCFLCLGAYKSPASGIRSTAFENEFNSTSEPSSCPTFKINTWNNIVKTDGSSVVTVTGKDFGWYFNVPTLLSGMNSNQDPNIQITIPNNELVITFGKGVGSDLSTIAHFTSEPGNQYQFNYSYEKPIITGYGYQEINGELLFVFYGSGFDYLNENEITLNGQSIIGQIATNGLIPFDSDKNPMDLVDTGKEFTVILTVGNQQTDEYTFTAFNQLNVVKPAIKLSTDGGETFTLKGNFGTSNSTIVKVFINDISSTVVSINSTYLTIISPSISTIGNYEISINIGGYLLDTSIEYIQPPSPTPSVTPSSTPSPSSEDEPSSSIILNISFYLLSFTLSFLILI